MSALEALSVRMNPAAAQGNRIACRDCRCYIVTWDSHFPHGCRAHGFKSKKSPSMQVYEASGMQCLLFTPKKPRAPAGSELQPWDTGHPLV